MHSSRMRTGRSSGRPGEGFSTRHPPKQAPPSTRHPPGPDPPPPPAPAVTHASCLFLVYFILFTISLCHCFPANIHNFQHFLHLERPTKSKRIDQKPTYFQCFNYLSNLFQSFPCNSFTKWLSKLIDSRICLFYSIIFFL